MGIFDDFPALQTIKNQLDELFSTLDTAGEFIEKEKPKAIRCMTCLKKFNKFADIAIHRRLYCRSQLIEIPDEEVPAEDEDVLQDEDIDIPLFKMEPTVNIDEDIDLGDEFQTNDEDFDIPQEKNRKPVQKKKVRNRKRHEPLCSVCGMKFTKLFSLKFHMARHEDVTRYCDLCGFKTTTLFSINQHMKTVHLPKKHICDICGKGFGIQTTMRTHREIHLKDEGIAYQCKKCPESFPTKHKLIKHIDMAHTQRSYICSVCGKDCKNYFAFYYHSKQDHTAIDDAGKIYECQLCGKAYKTKSYLEHHACVADPEKPRRRNVKVPLPEGAQPRSRGRPRIYPKVEGDMMKRKRGRPRKEEKEEREEEVEIQTIEVSYLTEEELAMGNFIIKDAL